MAGLLLFPFVPLFIGCLVTCRYLFRLLNKGTTSQRVVGWVLLIPCMLLALGLVVAIITILNPPPGYYD